MFTINRILPTRKIFLATTLFSAGVVTGASFSNLVSDKTVRDVKDVSSTLTPQQLKSPQTIPTFYLVPPDKKKGVLSGIEPNSLTPERIKNRHSEKEELKKITDLRKQITKAANYARAGTVAVRSEGGHASGFVYSSDNDSSIIITNNHVVENDVTYEDRYGRRFTKKEVPDEINIMLLDGRELSGKVIGRDRDVDVALIKVNDGNLPKLDLATSYPDYSDFVLSIGHPFDFGWTVVLGNYSGNDRELNTSILKTNVIQVSANVNPGHSGGPITNLNGEVIGINHGVIRTEDCDGLSFCIPFETVSKVATRILEK